MKLFSRWLSAFALYLALSARSAEAPAPAVNKPATTNTAPTQLSEVTVRAAKDDPTSYKVTEAATATRTDTPILQTPVSIQVIPQQVLQDQKVHRLDDALHNVSGVIPSNDGFGTGDSFTIRGFDQMEVTYEDGIKVDQYTDSGFAHDMANVERIEVIKGPAAVLYGRAEPGGLVNIVTKQPQENPAYAVEQQVGSFNFYRSTLDATGPLNTNKTWLYRFNASYENADSFRDFIHTDRLFLFPTIEWRPNDKNKVTVELKYGNGTDQQDMGIPFLADGTPAKVPISRNYVEPNANQWATHEYSVKLKAEHQFNDDWKVRLIEKTELHDQPAGYSQFYGGFDPFPNYYQTVEPNGNLPRSLYTEDYFQHLFHQLTVDATGKFDTVGLSHTVVGGFDFYHQQGKYNSGGFVANPPAINIYNPVYGYPLPAIDPTASGYEQIGQNAYGAFLQDQIELPKNIHLLAGFRYDQSTSFEHGTWFTADRHDTPPPTPRFGILWQAVPQASFFATYTENFGKTPLGSQAWGNTLLPAESAQQYEFGVKTEWFEKKLSATASIYQLTKQNVITSDPDPTHTNSWGGRDSVAVGEIRSQGIELDVAGKITPNLSVIGAYSYIDGVVTKDNNGLVGQRIANIPYNSGSIWTTYTFHDGGLKGLKFGVGLEYHDHEQDFGSNQGIPGYALVNAMSGYDWQIGKTKLSAQVNVNNVLDRTYYSSVSYSSAYPGAPINVLASLRLEF